MSQSWEMPTALVCLESAVCLQGGGNLGLRAYGVGKIVKFGAAANKKACKQVIILTPACSAAATYHQLHCITFWHAASALGLVHIWLPWQSLL